MDAVKKLRTEVARLRDHVIPPLEARIRELEAENKKLRSLTTLDPLTKIPNRAALDRRFAEVSALVEREKIEVACLMIDVDHFRQINELRGHQEGDRVLIEVARLLRVNIRTSDFVGRYGGEEFGVILVKAGNPVAEEIGERLRAAVENKWKRPKNRVTISIGIATTNEVVDHKLLIAQADQALYQAKNTGRNRVCVFGKV